MNVRTVERGRRMHIVPAQEATRNPDGSLAELGLPTRIILCPTREGACACLDTLGGAP